MATATVLSAVPSEAEACGGTFCDVNRGIPVNQVTETVLFATDGDTLEVHIQFDYTGDPDRFAWVIPVPAEPTFEIGSEGLFDGLDTSTQPTFVVDVEAQECDGPVGAQPPPPDDGGGGGGTDGGGLGCSLDFSGSNGRGSPAPPMEDGDEPEAADVEDPQGELVGSFEVEILRPQTVEELEEWLDTNEYQRDEDAPPIFRKYIEEGHVFAGLKLRPGANTDQIHPIVMRYRGDEPCIPLRLTRIAAEDDMGVRAYFLGKARVAPLNYRHVEINPLAINWGFGGADYDNVVAMAVDAGSNTPGRAFVTEYAGPSSVVDESGLSMIWFPERFATLPMETPEDIVHLLSELHDWGLMMCNSAGCSANHPLIQGILEEFLPPPDGVEASDFYRCPNCTAYEIDFSAWDGKAFVERVRADIVATTMSARALLRNNPVLTRLYTRISPQEMLADPLFTENPDLPPVNAVHRAHALQRCDGISVLTLDDGRQMVLTLGWPSNFDALAAERIELAGPLGAPIVEDGFREDIDEELVAYNEAVLERTGASVEAISIEWGGGIEPEEGCGRCRVPARELSGALWLGLIFGFVGWGRRRMMR